MSEAEPQDEIARQKELEDIKTYRSLVSLVEAKVKETSSATTPNTQDHEPSTESRESGSSALDLTSKLLARNPEYYTIWNHRRRLLQPRLRSLSPAEAAELLSDDLAFLVPLLRKFPKCYWMWNHRQWLLRQASALLLVAQARRFWLAELELVTHMLARDSRNFHGWGYRRAVVAALEEQELNPDDADDGGRGGPARTRTRTREEFDYTTRMIGTNLSNFSAWHNRSKLIPRLLEERGAAKAERKKMLDEGLLLISRFYDYFLTCARAHAHPRGTLHGSLRPIHLVLPRISNYCILGFPGDRLHRSRPYSRGTRRVSEFRDLESVRAAGGGGRLQVGLLVSHRYVDVVQTRSAAVAGRI